MPWGGIGGEGVRGAGGAIPGEAAVMLASLTLELAVSSVPSMLFSVKTNPQVEK